MYIDETVTGYGKMRKKNRCLKHSDTCFEIRISLYSSDYLVTTSTGTLKIFATFRIVSICLPVAAAK